MDIKILWALLGTLGYAALCRMRPADAALAALGGAIAWTANALSSGLLGAGIFSYLIAACCAGLYSELLGAVRKRPATIYAVAAIITLVPGGGMYYTLSAALAGNGQEASSEGFETLLIAGLIAAGIALSSAGARLAGEWAKARRA